MKRILLSIIASAAFISVVDAQTIAVKSNLLYDATTTINLGAEVALTPKLTLDLSGNYNPWEFSENKKLKHWLVQPELRYWLCNKFNGHFLGVHAHYGEFNMGGIKMLGMEDHRYEGNLIGAGLSYGYQWILNPRWSIEASLGVGYAYLDYKKYNCEKCGDYLGSYKKNYFGPTKVAVSLIYIIK